MRVQIIFGLMTFLLFAGCLTHDGDNGGNQSNVAPSENITNQTNSTTGPNVTINETNVTNETNVAPLAPPTVIENGKFGQVEAVTYGAESYGISLANVDFSAGAGANYLLLYFEVTNTGAEAKTLSPQIYAMGKGQKFQTSSAAAVNARFSPELDFSQPIEAGATVSGWVAVQLPKDQNQFDIYFEYVGVPKSETPGYVKWAMAI